MKLGLTFIISASFITSSTTASYSYPDLLHAHDVRSEADTETAFWSIEANEANDPLFSPPQALGATSAVLLDQSADHDADLTSQHPVEARTIQSECVVHKPAHAAHCHPAACARNPFVTCWQEPNHSSPRYCHLLGANLWARDVCSGCGCQFRHKFEYPKPRTPSKRPRAVAVV